jgi:hypothetical protein
MEVERGADRRRPISSAVPEWSIDRPAPSVMSWTPSPKRKLLISLPTSAAWIRPPADRPAAWRSPSTHVAGGYSFVLTYHKP